MASFWTKILRQQKNSEACPSSAPDSGGGKRVDSIMPGADTDTCPNRGSTSPQLRRRANPARPWHQLRQPGDVGGDAPGLGAAYSRGASGERLRPHRSTDCRLQRLRSPRDRGARGTGMLVLSALRRRCGKEPGPSSVRERGSVLQQSYRQMEQAGASSQAKAAIFRSVPRAARRTRCSRA